MVTSALLRWTYEPTTGFDGFKLYRKLSTDVSYPGTPLVIKGPTSDFHQDCTVVEGEEYNYKITVYNDGGESTVTETTVLIPDPTPPSAPDPVDTFTSEVDNNVN